LRRQGSVVLSHPRENLPVVDNNTPSGPSQGEYPVMFPTSSDKSVLALAWMMVLLPALGVPSELVVQDTLKSAVAAFGILFAALMLVWPGASDVPAGCGTACCGYRFRSWRTRLAVWSGRTPFWPVEASAGFSLVCSCGSA
jgi:hypothetical protein